MTLHVKHSMQTIFINITHMLKVVVTPSILIIIIIIIIVVVNPSRQVSPTKL